jgi:actin-like protein 6A
MLLSFLLYLDWLQDAESESVVSNSHTVVDYSGGASTNVAAVHDGYVLQKAIVKSAIGGDVLTECLLKTLESKGISIRPRFSFKRKEVRIGEFEVTPVEFPNTTESYYKYMQRVIAADVKEAVCRVPDSPFDDNSYANIPTTLYELPDGQ